MGSGKVNVPSPTTGGVPTDKGGATAAAATMVPDGAVGAKTGDARSDAANDDVTDVVDDLSLRKIPKIDPKNDLDGGAAAEADMPCCPAPAWLASRSGTVTDMADVGAAALDARDRRMSNDDGARADAKDGESGGVLGSTRPGHAEDHHVNVGATVAGSEPEHNDDAVEAGCASSPACARGWDASADGPDEMAGKSLVGTASMAPRTD